MKLIKTLLLILFIQITTFAQSDKPVIYNPLANAKKDVQNAIILADSLQKHVLLQIGGNWCPWCLRLNKFLYEDEVLDSMIHHNFVIVKVNYSKENMNLELLKTLDYPQRFGFPVLVVLDANGTRIHTQDSGYLEYSDGYDRKRVISFIKNWSPNALDAINYEKP
ncbi:MAG TPA: thioredoxin family protein [Bacteroidales bacterium]|nr:MAG: hypothetical protein A2W98_00470 [Bacteroidetes bacterium GWF2_33_38]OFY90224.1 MAG: hypothetical protein A2236_02770 [Bacteroidetes bacterium RIFOXYA2_FULL_33_7]HBF88247.1 thioredoxin family protein [Bacteroidales bacterium]